VRDRALLHVHDALVVIAGGVAPLGGLPARPALAPWCRVVEDGRRVLLEHGGTVVTLEGRAATALVPRLLPLLDGSRTADEVLDTLGPAARPGVQNALSILAEQGLLTEGPLARSDGGVEVDAATYVVSITGRSTQALACERLASAHVAIVGSAPAAAELRRLLRRSGVGHVERCPADRVPASHTLVVGAPSRAEVATLDELNDLALARRQAWLQVLPYDGRFVVAGPLYLPHVSACRTCWRTRRAACSGFEDDFGLVDGAPSHAPAPAPLAALGAALAATLVLRWLATADPALPGRFYALEARWVATLRFDHVLRVPRCTACGPAPRAVPSPWFESAR